MHISRRGGMADAADSKSVYGDIVRVQVPSPARKPEVFITSGFFLSDQKVGSMQLTFFISGG